MLGLLSLVVLSLSVKYLWSPIGEQFSFHKRRSLLRSLILVTCCQASSKIAQPWKFTTVNTRSHKQQNVSKEDPCCLIQRNVLTIQLTIEFSAASCQHSMVKLDGTELDFSWGRDTEFFFVSRSWQNEYFLYFTSKQSKLVTWIRHLILLKSCNYTSGYSELPGNHTLMLSSL